MLSALGQVLPIAFAMALSTVPITATILFLLSPRSGWSAVPFGVGWVVGLAVVSLGALLFGRSLPLSPTRGPQTAVGIAEVVIGLALIVVAFVSWRRGPRRKKGGSDRDWLAGVASLHPVTCFGLGLVLNIRPKGLLLGLAAGLAVAGDANGLTDSAFVLTTYVVISASTVVVPIVLTLLAPNRMQPRLQRARDWLTDNRRLLMTAITLLMGIVIIGAGLTRL